jgi:hypothetical protein
MFTGNTILCYPPKNSKNRVTLPIFPKSANTKKQIDQLIYKSYNFTPEEIAIVEGEINEGDQV